MKRDFKRSPLISLTFYTWVILIITLCYIFQRNGVNIFAFGDEFTTMKGLNGITTLVAIFVAYFPTNILVKTNDGKVHKTIMLTLLGDNHVIALIKELRSKGIEIDTSKLTDNIKIKLLLDNNN